MKALLIVLALVALFIASCAPPPRFIVNPQFSVYVKRFEAALGKKTHFSIRFGEMNDGYLGQCIWWWDGGVEVFINPNRWPGLSELEKEQVIFHELGHCELGREHDEEWIGDVMPRSIMYPSAFGDFPAYRQYHDYYVNELITNKVRVRDALTIHYDGDFQRKKR